MIRPIENFVEVETKDNFSLCINKPIYKVYKTTDGYIRNTRTGENVGKLVELHLKLYDENFNKLAIASYDEDCYEIVEEQL